MSPMSRSVSISAPAKLNLALSVGGVAPDGLHPICSWMTTVDLLDDLRVTRLPGDRLSRYAITWHPEARRRAPIDWSIRDDLAVRAHRALESLAGRPLPVQLHLQKRIPVGGGLGGGSADAAAMLRAVIELFDLAVGDEELDSIALELGSDVPFLLRGGSAIVEGRGERLEHLGDDAGLDAVLVLPEQASPTGPVYRRFDEHHGDAAPPVDAGRVRSLARTWCGQADGSPPSAERSASLFNDLAGPCLDLLPALAAHRTALAEIAGSPAHLTGSGSTLFLVCDDPMHAEALARTIDERLGLPAVAVRSAPTSVPRPVDEPQGAEFR